jgi:Permuted papain-like amidase enzyme, YaeF/YiiX, C92 family
MRKFLLAAGVFLSGASAQAGVQIAFLEFYTPDGRLIELEPGGRFAHVAISYRGGWLHAHPFRGVEVISTEGLSKMGKITSVVNVPQLKEIPERTVSQFLGKPYDADFSWTDDKIYCSELIAKIFGMKPEPMHFDPRLWPERYRRFEGLPGLSPDKVYRRILSVGRTI